MFGWMRAIASAAAAPSQSKARINSIQTTSVNLASVYPHGPLQTSDGAQHWSTAVLTTACVIIRGRSRRNIAARSAPRIATHAAFRDRGSFDRFRIAERKKLINSFLIAPAGKETATIEKNVHANSLDAPQGTSALSLVRARVRQEARGMQLKEIVHNLTDLIWQAEQQTDHPLDDAILSYVRDAVAVEVDYRRRMRELDRRLIDLETVHAVATPA